MKKRALPSDAAPSAKSLKRDEKSEEVDAVASAAHQPSLVCSNAEGVLNTMSLGVRRLRLNELGVSKFNRPISGKHAHKLGRRILTVEGFCRFRYKNGWCHEPSPNDPLEVAEYTNLQATRDPRLVPVPLVPLYGSWSKSHLMSFLQALASKAVYWSDTKELMVPDEAQAALMDHLQNGMFYEVFKYEAMLKMPQAVQDLIASDNFDAVFSLGQTETRLLMAIHQSLQVARTPVGKSQWDVVLAQVAPPPILHVSGPSHEATLSKAMLISHFLPSLW